MISVNRQFHDGMRLCVWLDERVHSEEFVVEQGLRHVCVLASLLFSILLAVVLNVAYMYLDIMDALVHLRKNKGAGGGGGGKQPPESQSWRRCFGACFTLTMRGSSRSRPRS